MDYLEQADRSWYNYYKNNGRALPRCRSWTSVERTISNQFAELSLSDSDNSAIWLDKVRLNIFQEFEIKSFCSKNCEMTLPFCHDASILVSVRVFLAHQFETAGVLTHFLCIKHAKRPLSGALKSGRVSHPNTHVSTFHRHNENSCFKSVHLRKVGTPVTQ